MLHSAVYPRIQPAPSVPSSNLRPFFSSTYKIPFQQPLSFHIHAKNTRGVGSQSAIPALRTAPPSQHQAILFLSHDSLPTTPRSLTPLQSADPKTKHLKSFRIRRSEKAWGEGRNRLTCRSSLPTVHYPLLTTSSRRFDFLHGSDRIIVLFSGFDHGRRTHERNSTAQHPERPDRALRPAKDRRGQHLHLRADGLRLRPHRQLPHLRLPRHPAALS